MDQEFKYVKNVNFPNRYVAPEVLHSYLQQYFKDSINEIGTSYLGLPIYQYSFGKGSISVLGWSQMHGNESTATLAMLDFLCSLKENPSLKEHLYQTISLDFIFMLNTDGAKVWTRRNALEIDINRDYLKSSSVEMKLLKKVAFAKKYHYALNLHDQRSVFSTDDCHPATLSFLAPSENNERSITENRKKSMAIIAQLYSRLKSKLPNMIGRYSDEFYPTSSGDNLMKAGIPTLLFEGGHYPEDYFREITRTYYTHALAYALEAISTAPKDGFNNYEAYFEIPENRETHVDLIYKNVKLNTDFECVLDIAVQYKEEIAYGATEISLVPYVVEVGDLTNKRAWRTINCEGKQFVCNNIYPKLDAPVNFEVI